MSEKRQPTAWRITLSLHDATRAYLRMNCDGECTVPLSTTGTKTYKDGGKRWAWDGNEQHPTISPSISCDLCGWHKTIVNGAAT